MAQLVRTERMVLQVLTLVDSGHQEVKVLRELTVAVAPVVAAVVVAVARFVLFVIMVLEMVELVAAVAVKVELVA